jgi:hypothetical protein
MKRKKQPKVSKSFQGVPNGRLMVTLPMYVTPSLNTMLGRNHWILTRLKKEAQQALATALQSRATAASSSTSTTGPGAANRS